MGRSLPLPSNARSECAKNAKQIFEPPGERDDLRRPGKPLPAGQVSCSEGKMMRIHEVEDATATIPPSALPDFHGSGSFIAVLVGGFRKRAGVEIKEFIWDASIRRSGRILARLFHYFY